MSTPKWGTNCQLTVAQILDSVIVGYLLAKTPRPLIQMRLMHKGYSAKDANRLIDKALSI
jgi:hypothetical protein